MKCLRKYLIFSKLLVIAVLLLAVSLPLSAWSFYSGETENVERISQLRDTILEQEAMIVAKDLSILELEIQINVLMQDSENWKGNTVGLEKTVMVLREDLKKSKEESASYKQLVENTKMELSQLGVELDELMLTSTNSNDVDDLLKQRLTQMEADQASLKTQLQESEVTTAKLQSDLEYAITLSGMSTEDYQALLDDYIPLQKAYDIAIEERDKYYQEAVLAKTTLFGGFVGAKALYDVEDLKLGIGMDIGFGYGNIMLTLGGEYYFNDAFDYKKFTYSAGLQYRF